MCTFELHRKLNVWAIGPFLQSCIQGLVDSATNKTKICDCNTPCSDAVAVLCDRISPLAAMVLKALKLFLSKQHD